MSDKVPAAEYLRMSTEHQRYSFENQHDVIVDYAESRHFSLVNTYRDGRSGVVLKRRDGLRQLLQDVTSGDAGYRAILVYDVSRWGRFQDADEAAHYEFICKRAGIPVHYCAEPFVNDGALHSNLVKALKRTMAGEYSRELGVKVLAGLRRLAGLGFKQGGLAGYGLRRMLISADGQPKQLLAIGERKSITTERVILVPGPEEELAVVREIYRLFVEDGLSVHAIAGELNERGIPYGESHWTHHTVQQILFHPKYTGCNIFGRTSQRLGTPSIRIPQSDWVLTPRAFEPIVSEEVYEKAKQILLNRTVNKSNTVLLESLRQLLEKQERLSLRLIKDSRETPSPSTYRKRFGSLRRAYQLIGYGSPSDFGPIDLRRRTQAIREELLREIQETCPDRIKIVRKGGRWRPCLRLKNGRIVTVLIAHLIKAKVPIWQVDPVRRECRTVTLLALLNKDNTSVREMRLFRLMCRDRRFNVKEEDAWLKSGLRLATVSDFCESVLCLVNNEQPIKFSGATLGAGGAT